MIEFTLLGGSPNKKILQVKIQNCRVSGQPLLFMLGLGFGLGLLFQKAGQGNILYCIFLVQNYFNEHFVHRLFLRELKLFGTRQFGFLKETLVAPASRFQIMFGKH